MARNDLDSSYHLFAPSKVTTKFQTFLLGPPPSSSPAPKRSQTVGRQSVKGKLSRRRPRPGFISPRSASQRPHKGAIAPTQLTATMAIEIPPDPQHGILKPVHINTDEVPWSVSVAENDSASFSIYVRTPTHHLTLTRTFKEISDLHRKLHDAYPNTALPPLPAIVRSAEIAQATMTNGNGANVKQPRKSSFLHTLSRLGNKDKHNHAASSSAFDSSFPPSPSSTSAQKLEGDVGALPAYLTTLANHPTFRSARPWKRFVHVRTDDLQSQRVERTIKRVRSDVAGHTSSTATTPGAGSTLWKESRRSVEQHAPSIASVVLPSPGGASTSASIHGVDDHALPKKPSSRPGTIASSIRKESTIGEAEDEREGDADAEGEDEDEAPTTPVVSQSQPQSLASAAALVNGTASAINHVDERPETPVQRPVRSEHAVGSESISSTVDTTESSTSTVPTSPETASDADASAASAAIAAIIANAQSVQLVQPVSAPTSVSAPSATYASGLSHSNSMKRSASADPRKRVASDESMTTASKHQHQHRAHPKHHRHHKHRADPERAFDTEAENAFDTDIEHPSSVTTPNGVTIDANGAVTDSELTKGPTVSGMISSLKQRKKKPGKKISINDFDMMRVLGKGCAGKVLLVRHRASNSLYALKAITKRHVLAHQELQHTLTEQAVLKRMSRDSQDPFVVKLWWSFHDKDNLFLVMDFHPGGDLATQLARWGRLGRDRARFYAAEIVEGVEGLHAAGVVYRDLKPENILIGSDGHIVLTDFGLSKEFPRPTGASSKTPTTPPGGQGLPRWMSNESLDQWRTNGFGVGGSKDFTNTFCGTAEYLAPEVIQGLPYSYEVDWWSFGTMLYEMLSGITPFWANNHSDMYVRVLQDELQFPEDKAMDQDTKSLIRGLLQRNPALRIKEPRIKRHPYFSMIDWSHVYYKRYIPPYIPPIDPLNASDTQNFDDAFLDMDPTLDDAREPVTDSERERTEDERTDDPSSTETPSGSTAGSNDRKVTATDVHIVQEDEPDVFDGYSFKGRQSVIIDGEEEFEDDVTNTGHERVDEVVHLGSDIEAADEASDLHTDQEREVGPDDVSEVSIKSHPIPAHLEEPPASKPPSVHDVKISDTIPEPIAEKDEVDPGISDLFTASEMFLALQTPLPPSPLQLPPEIPPMQEEKPLAPLAPMTPTEAKKSPELPKPIAAALEGPRVPTKPPPALRQPPGAVSKPTARPRREKSGIPALDRFIELEDQDEVRDPVPDTHSDDDDWDFVEKDGGEDVNGPSKQGGSLWARGVVDRYKLAVVFRKSSTPTQRSRTRPRPSMTGSGSRSDAPSIGSPDGPTSPSPSDSKRRGRTAGLNIRKSTRQFLRAKSPISFSPSSTPKRPPFLSANNSPANSTRQASLSTLAPTTNSRSVSGTGTTINIGPPSLRSKASDLSNTNLNTATNSLGSPSSSHPSLEATGATSPEDSPPPQMASLTQSASEIVVGSGSKDGTVRGPKSGEGEHGDKRNFSEKMKVGAEKVKSLFTAGSSQKQQQQQQSPPQPTPSS